MKQVLQSARDGTLELAEVPAPELQAGQVRVRNAFSVVSPGTERLMMDFARKSLAAKARSRPDLVRQVVRKLAQDGPAATYRTVKSRLESPQPLGYACAGIVDSVAPGVARFRPGDRVACAGAGHANHAEFVAVPENLCVRVPEGVDLRDAAFATIGAIAMQGVRIATPALGEIAVVIGLGLIGQLTVQLLRAAGCRVLAIDIAESRAKLAEVSGADWVHVGTAPPSGWIDAETAGMGADLAIVTAAAETAAPVGLAAETCRKKGRVVVVGMMPLELERRVFYDKELELRMSTSYGPGRYDRRFEEIGLDYPLPYVRWTENRNLESFLQLVAAGSVRPSDLPLETVAFEEAERCYAELAAGSISGLGVVFRYAEAAARTRSQPVPGARAPLPGALGISLIGAGTFARGVLLPALPDGPDIARRCVVTATGPSGRHVAGRFGFSRCATDPEEALGDAETGLVVITTRHDSHAALARAALEAGKAVWLEKPLGIGEEEVSELLAAARSTAGFLSVGYNRRFSRHAIAIRAAFADRRAPLAIHYGVAAGATPAGTWITDPSVGGGRVVGEVCHFVDLCAWLVGGPPDNVYARSLSTDRELDDSTVAVLGFGDGSTATIEYLARSGPELPKERIEVSGGGMTARCENFRSTRIGNRRIRGLNQDKGHASALREVIRRVRCGEPSPFALEELAAVSAATFAIERSIASGRREEVRWEMAG